jgi:hypothetical protein
MIGTVSSRTKGPVALSGQALVIGGDVLAVEHRQTPLDEIRLDPSNPRIQFALEKSVRNGKLTQEQLGKLILDLPGVSDLFKAIRDNGGLLEPIYVGPAGRIIEGNCRAAAYLKLRDISRKNGGSKNGPWSTIWTVFIPKISERQVAVLQGTVHLAGKNKWRAFEKAGHLYTMHTKLSMDAKSIAQSLSMTEAVVTRELKAYEAMSKKLLPKMKGSTGLNKWSFFEELYKIKALEQFRSKPANIDTFVSLVAAGKLKHGADVRKLAKILKHPTAVAALKTDGIASAMSIVGRKDITAVSPTFRKLKDVSVLLQHLPNEDIQLLRDPEPQLIVKELFAALKTVAQLTGLKLS